MAERSPQQSLLSLVVTSLSATGPQRSPVADPGLHALAGQRLGRGPVGWAVERATMLTDMVVTRYPDRTMAVRALQCLNEEVALAVLLELTGLKVPASDYGSTMPELGANLLADKVPLDRVVATNRVAQQFWIDAIISHAVATGARSDAQQKIVIVVTRVMNRFLDKQIKEYLTGQRRLEHSDLARRRRVVDSLVRGHVVETDVARDHLALDLDHHHVAVVLRTGNQATVGLDALELGAVRVGRALGDCALLMHEAAKDTLWVWASAKQAPDPAAVARTRLAGRGVSIGVGSAHPGAAGFRRSHLEAIDAERVARTAGTGPVVLHRDVSLAVLLQRDPERARWFVETYLGALGEPGAPTRDLRDTLRTFHRSQMRLVTAASELGVHRNTLIGRLRRIEELLGHPLAVNIAEVMCALTICDLASGDSSDGPAHGVRPRAT